jgi:methylmalonyl-CoA mutase N-terminal domain/subunit
VDPLAGSYVIEHLTSEIERLARVYIDKIDAIGGALEAIEQGYIQQEIADAAYRYQSEVDAGDRIVVGVNAYRVEEDGSRLERLVVDPAIEDQQRARLSALRAHRDGERAVAALTRIEAAARTPDEPLMGLFVAAVEADCTLGEICGVLRQVWGEYRPQMSI